MIFLEETDVTGLGLDQIIKFNRYEVAGNKDENDKPLVRMNHLLHAVDTEPDGMTQFSTFA